MPVDGGAGGQKGGARGERGGRRGGGGLARLGGRRSPQLAPCCTPRPQKRRKHPLILASECFITGRPGQGGPYQGSPSK